MRIRFFLSLLMLAVCATSTAQIITLRGKVTDAKTGEVVPGASILSGAFGTSADGNGNFVFYVQQSVIEQSGITASCLGFQTIHIANIVDNFTVALAPAAKELAAVNVSAGADYIVQRAYRQIPLNYLDRSFNLTGIQTMVHSVRDTFGYQYFYLNNAKVKCYITAYTDKPWGVQVGLMEKNEKTISDPKARKIPFLNGYRTPPGDDFVLVGRPMLNGDITKYSYKLNRKELIDGRKTYVVNFYSNAKEGDAGILYIDTATYAFVRVLQTKYNTKIASFINLDKVTVVTQYKRYGDRWALDAVKYNSITDYKGYDVERMEQLQVGVLDTEHAAELPAKAIIKANVVDADVNPYKGFTSADKKMPKDIQKLMDSNFHKIKIPKIAEEAH